MTKLTERFVREDRLLEELENRDAFYDGHAHTRLSDGHLSPEELCALAAASGVGHLAVTDHDHAMSPARARALSLRYGLNVIPGVELNAVHGDTLVHLNLLWVPDDDAALNALLRHNGKFPSQLYCQAMLYRLLLQGIDPSGKGVHASCQMILEQNPDSTYLGKGAVADLVVQSGFAASRAEVSERYLGEYGERLCYVDKRALFDFVTMEEVLRTVQRLNRERDRAVLVTLNHPYYYRLPAAETETLIRDFSQLGGHALEVHYPRHTPERVAFLQGCCEKYGLLPNVGSDYHYDAHSLAKGGPALFKALLNFHKKK